MDRERLIKLGSVFAIGIVLWFIPTPAGLSPKAWHMFAIYLSAIVGVVLKPFNEAVIMLTAIGTSAIFLNNIKDALSGYSSTTTWLIFSAFAISAAFVSTGLGKRIAYVLIRKFGNTTLKLGYVSGLLDLIISPATPSNTARAGGIVTPIMHSVTLALGSEPGKSPEKGGAFLWQMYICVRK